MKSISSVGKCRTMVGSITWRIEELFTCCH